MSSAARKKDPTKLGDLITEEAEDLFKTLDPALRDKCRRAYAGGKRTVQNGTESSPSKKTSGNPAGQSARSRPSSTGDRSSVRAMTVRETLSTSSPLVKLMSKDQLLRMITKLQQVFGHKVNKERAMMLADVLEKQCWTIQEAANAYQLICVDEELAKEINYARTIAPNVFAMAKKRFEVKRGRLFDYSEALWLSKKHEELLHVMFDVVCVKGHIGPDGEEVPYWKIKDDFSPKKKAA